MNKLQKRFLFIIVIFLLCYFLFEVVYADESDVSVSVEMQEDVEFSPTPTPTMTPTPTPTPTPTITPTPELRQETAEFYDNVLTGIEDVRTGQTKILISIWSLVGVLVGIRILKDVFG